MREVAYYGLDGLLTGNGGVVNVGAIDWKPDTDGHLTIGYHGTFSFGRQGIANDVNFRKISRVLVAGKVSLCREVFGDTLNEGRDPDRGLYDDR